MCMIPAARSCDGTAESVLGATADVFPVAVAFAECMQSLQHIHE